MKYLPGVFSSSAFSPLVEFPGDKINVEPVCKIMEGTFAVFWWQVDMNMGVLGNWLGITNDRKVEQYKESAHCMLASLYR